MSLKLPRNWDLTTLRGESTKIARSKSVIPGDGGVGSAQSDIKRSMEKPLKKGWLKKQRSIVKNWKPCYFVLRGNVLTYHKDDRESAVQGTIPLGSSKVRELPSNTDDKFIFEIVPRSNGDREHDSYVLMASSQSEMEDWVRVIRRAIGAQGSGVFGKSLVDIMAYEKKLGPRLVPMLVEKCTEFIRKHGLDEEGIFRLPGQENQVKHFREAFDAGERPSFPDDTDVHTVASLLKLYLRELPEPVVPWTQYQDFLDSSINLDATTAAGKEKLEKQISLLPKVNYNLLSYICRFLFDVQQHSKVNKMSVENLATVMGVNLFKPQVEDAFSMMKGTPMIQKVMTVMIRHHELLFPASKDTAPSPAPAAKKLKSKKAANPRNFVGWESAECEMSLSESPEEEEVDTFETEKSASKVTPSLSPTSPPPLDILSVSPRKRTQTLPSLSGPPGFRTSREPSCDRWSYLQETLEEQDEKTFSEDIFKILDLQKVTLFPGKQNSNDIDEGNNTIQERRRSSNGEVKPTEPQAKPKENSKQSLPSLSRVDIVKLQPQSVTQKKEDNATEQQQLITSLQQRNNELSVTVAKLQAQLENERRSKEFLENSLRNAERSRDEALRRNEQLERETQAFMGKAKPK
ncbi:rho GTPase-activating protein 25 isoform X1 [Tachysurus fulvidraco]|uniref:rho GTPase-activating protein 25 isoform X1 n=2 Tax=Tachysurus fulvidraco TaxID=1234273 RepID=UPI001FEECFCB|nr:rho GTPase-activating protein 25 isoform X1 [Tachysurus fulvidraco]XP_047673944.1 rho GTPase-activating protein 25 isoform X1 [Tachysurus fulvidraco]